jgi:hypothetical protein
VTTKPRDSGAIPRRGRRLGYALMACALLVAGAARLDALGDWNRAAITATVLVLAAVGVMLVLTEMMVRGLYAQVDEARTERNDATRD